MPRFVERRTDQIIHGGVQDDDTVITGHLLANHIGDQHASRANKSAAWLQHHFAIDIRDRSADSIGIGLDRGRRFILVANAKAAADIKPAERDAICSQAVPKRAELGAGGGGMGNVPDLGADMHGDAHGLQARRTGRPPGTGAQHRRN